MLGRTEVEKDEKCDMKILVTLQEAKTVTK
jgi:hypothetical protein